MTRISRVLAPPLLSAAIFGATFGLAGAAGAAAGVDNDGNMQQVHDPRAHQTVALG